MEFKLPNLTEITEKMASVGIWSMVFHPLSWALKMVLT